MRGRPPCPVGAVAGWTSALLALLGVSTPALAESPPARCYSVPKIQPMSPLSITANAPAFLFYRATGWGETTIESYDLQLRRAGSSDLIPVGIEKEGDLYLVRPRVTLASGEYRVSFRDPCVSWSRREEPLLVS